MPVDGKGVKVALSSGDVFFIDADLDAVEARFQRRAMVRIGSRSVNSTQVAQLTVEPVPSIEIPESLED